MMGREAIITTLLVVLYFAVLVTVVRSLARRRDDSMGEFAVAGRSFPWWLTVFTMLGTMYTGYQYTGGPGWAQGSGLIAMYGMTSFIGAFGIIYFLAPKVWLWGKAHDLYNSPEIVNFRFNNYPLSVAVAIGGMIMTFPWYVMAMIIFGQMTNAVTGGAVPAPIGILVVSLFMAWYCLYSGQRGVVITDFIQGMVCFFGMLIVIYLTARYFFGGFTPMFDRVIAESPQLLKVNPPELYISYAISSALCGVLWLECYTRMLVAKSTRDTRLAAVCAISVGVFLLIMAYGVGVGSSLIPEAVANPEGALLYMVRTALGPIGLAVICIAIIAGEMSYIDSSIVTNSVIFSKHFVNRQGKLNDRQMIRISRYFVLFWLAAAYFLSLLDLPMLWRIAVFTVEHLAHMFPAVVIGMLWKKATPLACWLGLATGVPITSFLYLRPDIADAYVSPWGAGLAGLVVNISVFIIVSLLSKTEKRVDDIFDEVDRLRAEEKAGLPAD